METYIVTGAAGFIGAKLSHKLLNLGYNVVGIDNINNYYSPILKKLRLTPLLNNKNFTFLNIDIENIKQLKESLYKYNNINAVFHMAARAGVRYSIENPQAYINTNVNGLINIMNYMVFNKIKKIILASTSSLYHGEKSPFLESYSVNTPISPYSVSKKSAELMAYTYHHLYDIDVSITRYFTVYGPYGRPDMCILKFIKCILNKIPLTIFGNGEQSRDFTYIDDIVDGTFLSKKYFDGYQIFNLGSGTIPISLKEIIKTLQEITGIIPNINYIKKSPGDLFSTQASIEKANKLLNWHPKTSILEGLKKTVIWYKKYEKDITNLI